MEAKNSHKRFLQLNATNSSDKSERLLLSMIAERDYIVSSQMMSQKLAASFVNFDLICIGVGLFCLVTVCKYFDFLTLSMRQHFKVEFYSELLVFRHCYA